MNTNFHGMGQLGVFLLLFGFATGCGSSERTPSSSLETTSAPVPGTVGSADFARVERERDEARGALQMAAARHEAERSKFQEEMRANKERDEFAAKAWGRVGQVEAELRMLKDKAARGSARERQKIEKAISDVQARLDVTEGRMRKIPSEVGVAWPDTKASIEAAIDELERAVRKARE